MRQVSYNRRVGLLFPRLQLTRGQVNTLLTALHTNLSLSRTQPRYDLASGEHSHSWEERLFMMVQSGHCHTFNPTSLSLSGLKGQINLYLGDKDSGPQKDFTYGYKIYLHERGQFWPSADMLRLGQTEAVNLKTRTLLEGEFQLVERRILNTPTRPCEEDERFSFTECMMEFLARRVGCHLDWVGTWTLPQYPPCSSLQELRQFQH